MRAYLLSFNESKVLDQWDSGMVLDLLQGNLWTPPGFPQFDIVEVKEIPKYDKAVVVIPARHHAGEEDRINDNLKNIRHAVLFLIGDEEAVFDVSKIDLPSDRIWVQNPHPGKHDAYNKIGTGYPQHIKVERHEKTTDIFFSGQITHKRREEMVGNLKELKSQGYNVDLIETEGFTQGLEPIEYYKRMSQSKLAPAPAGAEIPDSFRLYEALECMCVAMADDRNSQDTISNYWSWLLDEEPPFIKIDAPDEVAGISVRVLNLWPKLMHKQTEWYIKYKRKLSYQLMEALCI